MEHHSLEKIAFKGVSKGLYLFAPQKLSDTVTRGIEFYSMCISQKQEIRK